MKILKYPDDPKSWAHKVRCGCEAELEVDADDVSLMPGDRPGEPSTHYVVCPCCSDRIWLTRADVPSVVERYVLRHGR